MQSTGQTLMQRLQPEHSSGITRTSMPSLKIAPNCGGHSRIHESQTMHSQCSMRTGGFFHLGLSRTCRTIRSSRSMRRLSLLTLISRNPITCQHYEGLRHYSHKYDPYQRQNGVMAIKLTDIRRANDRAHIRYRVHSSDRPKPLR